MSAPTQPTKTTICTEALKRFLNGGTPESADITRAEDYGLEKVKRDIMNLGKTWRPLLRTVYGFAIPGAIPNPIDFERDLSVGLMTYVHANILAGVSNASLVTLAATENATQVEVQGKTLIVFSASAWDTMLTTGAYDGGYSILQGQRVVFYDPTTKECSLAPAFSTTPATGDSYMVVNQINDLVPFDMRYYDKFALPGKAGIPARYTSLPDDTVGSLALYPSPDDLYPIRRRYYADLMKVDTSSTLYNTILRRWADVFEQGVFVWALGEDDGRYQEQTAVYQQYLANILAVDLDGYKEQPKQ